MARSLSMAALKAVYEHFALAAQEAMREDGVVAPQVFAVAVKDEDVAGVAAVDPSVVAGMLGSPEGKDRLAQMIRMLLEPGNPVRSSMKQAYGRDAGCVVVQVMESWILSGVSPQEVEQAYERYSSLAEHPLRKEVVLVSLHCDLGSFCGMSAIEQVPVDPVRAPKGKIMVLGELRTDIRLAGRFSMDLRGEDEQLERVIDRAKKRGPSC